MLVGNKVDKVYSFRTFTIICSPFIFSCVLQSCKDFHVLHPYVYLWMEHDARALDQKFLSFPFVKEYRCFSDFNAGVPRVEVNAWFLLLNVCHEGIMDLFGAGVLVFGLFCCLFSFSSSRFLGCDYLSFFSVFSQVTVAGLYYPSIFLYIRNIRRRVIFVWFYLVFKVNINNEFALNGML